MSQPIPRTLLESWMASLENSDAWELGKLCPRAIHARHELIEREESEHDDIEAQINAVIDLLESPIEQVAAFHLLGRNYAPFTSDMIVHARMYRDLPEEWPEGVIIAIVPQVDIGRYRVDFMVHLRNGAKFAVECDGADFHRGSREGFRDAVLAKSFRLPIVRIRGASIWESPLWTNEVRKTVFMLLGVRNAEAR